MSRADGMTIDDLRRSEADVWDHWGMDPIEKVIEVGRPPGRIRVQEMGSGPPVLLIHGTGGYGPYWAPLVAGLGGYRSLMVDRPGWGGSDPVDYSQSTYKEFVAGLMVEVLDELGVEKVHSVGASIGDTWALSLASKHPERVHSVALLGAGPLTDEVMVPTAIKLLRSPLGRMMSRVRWREKMETGQARQSGHGPSLDGGRMPQVYVDWKVEMTNDTDWRVHERAMVRSIVGPNGWKAGLTFDADDLSSVSVPLLMVYGTNDAIGTEEAFRRFVGSIPGGSLHLVEDAGHLPWFDDPRQVSGLLRDHFLSATT